MTRVRLKDKAIEYFLMLNGLTAVLILFGIFSILFYLGLKAFKEIAVSDFLFGTLWEPNSYEMPSYGILAMLVSTLMISFGSMVIAVPLGLGCALYLAEVASPRTRELLKPTIEVLAGIPSVVIGFIGVVLIGPLISRLFGISNGLNALNGSFLLAIMALPTIISISEDAISAVPRHYREASMALGGNRWQTMTLVVVPAAFSGIVASVMLGIGRAIGETMTVLMATGNAAAMPSSFLNPVRTMTAAIAIELGEVSYDTTHYYALFSLGLMLFFLTFIFNLVADLVLQRYQNVQR